MGVLSSILWFILVVAVIVWALGFFVAHLGSFIHIALAIAVIVLIWNLIVGGTRRGAY